MKALFMALAFLSVLNISAALATSPVPINVGETVADGAVSAEKVVAAISASRMLTAQLRALSSAGQLKEIRIVGPDEAISRQGHQLRAWFDNGVITLTTDIVASFSTVETERFPKLDYTTNNPNDLAFLLGFMAARAQNADSNAAEMMKIQEKMKQASSNLAAGEHFDVTPYVKDLLALQLGYTARAYINGWGALRDAAESENSEKIDIKKFTNLMMKSKTFPLLNIAVNKGKFDLRSDGRIPLTPDNVQAVMMALSESTIPEFD